MDNGQTNLGSENGAPNTGMLNVNVNNTEALNIFDASSNAVVFDVKAKGKTVVGAPASGASNSGLLNLNVASNVLTNGFQDAINIYDAGSSNLNNKVVFRVKQDGTTYIGENRPLSAGVIPDAKLSVDGKILAREVRIAISANTHWQWPDYVFKEDYELMPLSAVSEYIKVKKHLPGVPSAKVVSERGIEVAEISAILLSKVEELYLHIIEQEEKIKTLNELILKYQENR